MIRKKLCKCMEGMTTIIEKEEHYKKHVEAQKMKAKLFNIDFSNIDKEKRRKVQYYNYCPVCKGLMVIDESFASVNVTGEELILEAIKVVKTKFDVPNSIAGTIVKNQLLKYHTGKYINYINKFIQKHKSEKAS